MSISAPIVHKTRTQAVVEVLREKILSGHIAAGEALRQSALATELNVSRIPIREALLQLEAEGLVKFEAHKGATATALSTEQVTELFELRAIIETDLLAKAIPNMSQQDLDQAEQLLTELELAFKQQQPVSRWSELNSQFHTSLYRPADRPYALDMVQGLKTNCDRYIRLQLLKTGGIAQAQKEHRELLKHCQNKHIDAAVSLLRQHILLAAESIRKLVKPE